MFKLFKRKVNEKEVIAFNSAIKAIEIYIELFEYQKAKSASNEILTKEKTSLEKFIENNKSEKEIEKAKKDFAKKEETIKKLLDKIYLEEKNYNENIKKERFNIRFRTIKKEIDLLLWQAKAVEAMSLLTNFYNENKNEIIVINFYKQQKNIIKKIIDKKLWRLEDRIKFDTQLEAMSLIWQKIKESDIKKVEKKSFIEKIKDKLEFYYEIKRKKEEKKLLDEINILIDEDSKIKKELAVKKLEKIHSWLVKELNLDNMIWYDLYWKILWADKISGDTFGIEENNENYILFLWDATWHWVKAGFIISIFNKILNSLKNKRITEIFLELNNQLKQKLESRNFITWALFEINKQNSNISYAGLWHEPILIYRNKTWKVEKKVLWWLAAWIRIIKDPSSIKIKTLNMENDDIILMFSDWIIETRWINWDFYNIETLIKNFEIIAKNTKDIKKIYNLIMEDIKLFTWWSKFQDDASIILVKRNTEKDIIKKWDNILKEIKEKENLKKDEVKKLEWETKLNINKKLQEIRKQKETKRIVKILEDLYYSWEILQLKQEAIRYIKEWYIDKKINYYLKTAIENENTYKIEQKNQKMQNKFNILKWLYKKWDYDTVIKEIEYIILKDWNF